MKGFGKITRRYLGKSFDECNCLRLLYDIFTDIKIKVPSGYKGYDLNTYMAYWEEKPEQAINDMIDLFQTMGKETDPRFLKQGDVIVVKYKSFKFPGIYIGNNNFIVATKEKGVVVMPLGKRLQIILARRLM